MKVRELGHIVLTVSDLEASIRFYRDILGFKQVSQMGDRGAMFSAGRTHHELFLQQARPGAAPIPEGRPIGLSHFALKIGTTDEELRSAIAEVKAAGVTIDHMTDHGVTHSVYLRDPDGNCCEIYIDAQPELWRDDPSVVGGSNAKPLMLEAQPVA
jgi:catechol 2,3-dioxygenase